MSMINDALRAFAAGAMVSCMACAATAYAIDTRVTIDNFTFKSDAITVPVGTTVMWENDDDIPHTVVSLDGTFRSRALDTEDKYSFTFDKAGTYEYFCSLHPQMTGKVIVKQ
jgi:plastocyanin